MYLSAILANFQPNYSLFVFIVKGRSPGANADPAPILPAPIAPIRYNSKDNSTKGVTRMDGVQVYLLFAGIGALIGALVTPLVYWAKGRKPASGFFAGVLVGALGNLILLIPLWIMLKPRTNPILEYFNVSVAYSMGASAVTGGRREEARYYFSQVTQADPRNIGAWLYLANLATTPLEAWSYIQQARAVDPANPAVQEAVAVVWPQVQHLYGESYGR
ncbi:MAG: hypothetical protein IT324_10485 [Anaerolineae bacterium]|nr:hypothetical protein [Anaerolineae bacterium]